MILYLVEIVSYIKIQKDTRILHDQMARFAICTSTNLLICVHNILNYFYDKDHFETTLSKFDSIFEQYNYLHKLSNWWNSSFVVVVIMTVPFTENSISFKNYFISYWHPTWNSLENVAYYVLNSQPGEYKHFSML